MTDMQELVTVEQAERVIGILAIALPAAGLLVGLVVGAARRRVRLGLGIGLLCGATGPAIWLLWRMYNGVIGVWGLDSVKGLLINLSLFAAIGLVMGVVIGLVFRRRNAVGMQK